jgi:hypothetical protein
MIHLQAPADPGLRRLLSGRPEIDLDPAPLDSPRLVWDQDGWRRTIHIGPPRPLGQAGLLELMDNNPLVCADEASTPPPAAALALAAFGPIWQAGLALDEPAFESSSDAQLRPWLETVQFSGDFLHESRGSHHDLESLNLFLPIRNPGHWSDLDDLYREAYGGAFSVEEWGEGDEPALAPESPMLAYRLRITPGEDESLFTVQTAGRRDGRLGPAQAVQMLNVMCGWEECLGLAYQPLSRS